MGTLFPAASNIESTENDPFDLVGDVIDGQFRVEEFVGEGELSVLYRGRHQGVDAPIAIKCLNLPETLAAPLIEPIAASFREGARVHYRLARGHLHIAQTIACGTTLAPRTGKLVPYVAREWLHGKSLAADFADRARTKTAPRTAGQAVDLLDAAADALAYAHSEGVAHHAVNPRNLFLTTVRGAQTLKLLDFGLATPQGESAKDASPKTAAPPGLRLLQSTYAAPEQLDRMFGAPCMATDVFALALVLFEALAGYPYFAVNTHVSEVLRIVVEERKRLSGRLPISVPRALESLLTRALAPTPKDRHADLNAFWMDVKRAVWRPGMGTSRRAPQPMRAPLPSIGLSALPPWPSEPPPAPPAAVAVAPQAVGTSTADPLTAVAGEPTPPAQIPPAKTAAARRGTMLGLAPGPAADALLASPFLAPVSAAPAPRPFITPPEPASTTAEIAPPVVAPSDVSVPVAEPPRSGRLLSTGAPTPVVTPALVHPGTAQTIVPWVQRFDALATWSRSRVAAASALVATWSRSHVAPASALAATWSRSHVAAASALVAGFGMCMLVVALAVASGHRSRASGISPHHDPRVASPHTKVASEQDAVLARWGAPFDRTTTKSALDAIAADLASCTTPSGPRGPGSIHLLILPNGQISRVQIGPPFAGTPADRCIRDRFMSQRLPSFTGAPRTMNYVIAAIR
jgi:serine/threonine-protein kinase